MGLSRSRSLVLGAVLAVVSTVALWAGVLPRAGAVITNPTIVSITFDDGDADQLAAAQTMKNNNIVGTFYVPTGWIGAAGYLTLANLRTMAANGNEIGGHTVTHADLTQVSASEAKAQICNGRAVLQSWGFQPVSFAYPFSTSNPTAEQLAQQCGYNTSRGLGDIRSPQSCSTCPTAEVMPPANRNYLKAPDQVDSTWTLAQLKAQVTNAANNGGGWVILTFHHVCANIGAPDCQADQSITPTVFNQFIAWLKTYRDTATNKTTVRTVDQVVRQYMGTTYPAYRNATSVPPRPPAGPGVNGLLNPSLETGDAATGYPSCFQPGGWGANSPSWATATPGLTGNVAEQLTMANYQNGDAKLLPTLDLYSCAPSVTPGKAYDITTWYQSTAISQFALYYRDASGAWFYWTSSPWLAPSATPTTWTQATFTTPAVPAGATAMTFGLALIQNGTLRTDDYALVESGTAGAAATSAATTSAATTTAGPQRPRPPGPTAPSTRPGRPTTTRPQPPAQDVEVPGGNLRPGTQIAVQPPN